MFWPLLRAVLRAGTHIIVLYVYQQFSYSSVVSVKVLYTSQLMSVNVAYAMEYIHDHHLCCSLASALLVEA
jgi:hypothetical protein